MSTRRALAVLVLALWGFEAEGHGLAMGSAQDGAGLLVATQADGRYRVWTDVGLHAEPDEAVLALVAGGSYLLRPRVELGAQLPVASYLSGYGRTFGMGNVTLLVRHVNELGPVRLVAGATVAGPRGWMIDGAFLDGFQHPYSWFPYRVAASVPVHAEVGEVWVGTLDAALQAYHHGRWWSGSDVATLLAPGVALRPTTSVVSGVRAPWLRVYTRDEPYDHQLSVEPWVRVDAWRRAFVSARLNVPLAGYIDHDASWWGLMLGAGVSR